MTSSLFDFVAEKLHTSDNPVGLLVNFFANLFNYPDNEIKTLYPIFSKLINLYGVKRTFLAITDCYDINYGKIDFSKNIYALLAYFIKRRYEKDSDSVKSINNLDKAAESNIVYMNKERKRRMKIPKIFDEEVISG